MVDAGIVGVSRSHRRSTTPGKRLGRIALGALATLVVLDLATWAVHVQWRMAALEELTPVTDQIDRLAVELAEDDEWIERKSRLAQQYAEHDQFTERIESRGRRRVAHNALVDAYNGQLALLYSRFYLAPLPAPEPPFRILWDR